MDHNMVCYHWVEIFVNTYDPIFLASSYLKRFNLIHETCNMAYSYYPTNHIITITAPINFFGSISSVPLDSSMKVEILMKLKKISGLYSNIILIPGTIQWTLEEKPSKINGFSHKLSPYEIEKYKSMLVFDEKKYKLFQSVYCFHQGKQVFYYDKLIEMHNFDEDFDPFKPENFHIFEVNDLKIGLAVNDSTSSQSIDYSDSNVKFQIVLSNSDLILKKNIVSNCPILYSSTELQSHGIYTSKGKKHPNSMDYNTINVLKASKMIEIPVVNFFYCEIAKKQTENDENGHNNETTVVKDKVINQEQIKMHQKVEKELEVKTKLVHRNINPSRY